MLAALRARGGELLPGDRGVRVQGWRVEATQRPIMGRDDLHRCVRSRPPTRAPLTATFARSAEESLDARGLPEMLFGSTLELKHEASGVALSFNALDALREWKARAAVAAFAVALLRRADARVGCAWQEESLPPLQVACAAAWTRSHDTRLREGAIKGWEAAGVAPSSASPAYDWTYTTPYAGSVVAAPGAQPPRWQPVDERIDRTLLMARDPILFFDELTLYESELDDNGAMSLTVKARSASAPHANERVRLTRARAGARHACVLVRASALLAPSRRRHRAVRPARHRACEAPRVALLSAP